MVALVFVLGLKHGFDPDHLVAIDGMARSTKSRWCGVFFSLGHGVVVTLVSVAVALAATEWQAPAWLEHTGALISGRWLAERLAGASHPAVIASVGAAFAVSFDTVSHALLLSASGLALAAALGLIFTLGMVATDAVHGLWVAKMIAQADHRAAAASRWMSGAIALLCLALAVGSLIAHAVPAPAISLATFVVILAACVLASRSAYREAGS